MKKKFEIVIEATTEDEVCTKFDIIEGLALSNDWDYLKLILAMNNQFKVGMHRRKRTKKEREQRARFMGFDSFQDVAK